MAPSSALGALDHHFDWTVSLQELDAGVDPAELDEPARVAEVAVEYGEVSPGCVVGDVTYIRIDTRGCALRGQLPRSVGDLLRRVVVRERQRQRQHRHEVPSGHAVLERRRDDAAL